MGVKGNPNAARIWCCLSLLASNASKVTGAAARASSRVRGRTVCFLISGTNGRICTPVGCAVNAVTAWALAGQGPALCLSSRPPGSECASCLAVCLAWPRLGPESRHLVESEKQAFKINITASCFNVYLTACAWPRRPQNLLIPSRRCSPGAIANGTSSAERSFGEGSRDRQQPQR